MSGIDFNIVVYLATYCFVIIGGQETFDRPEGSPCRWENLTGVCVDARRCATIRVDIREHTHPPVCSFQGKYAIICCTACIITDTIEPKPPQMPRLLEKCRTYADRLPFECYVPYHLPKPKMEKQLDQTRQCYQNYTPPHVGSAAGAGGVDSLRDQHPHMVLLGYGSSRESAQWLCSGSIISDRFILTAAHCASQPQLGPVSLAAMGILKRSDPPEFWQVYGVKRFIPHPRYQPPFKYDDIAIIETDAPIKFGTSVLPSCVGEEDLANSTHINRTVGYALGWGRLGHRKEVADTLQRVKLEKFTAEECSKMYPPHRHLPRGFDPTTQICYGSHSEIRDTCPGDSGGPLIRTYRLWSCSSHVIGVTSYGRDCGFPGNAGIYTRVREYEPWIEGIVFS